MTTRYGALVGTAYANASATPKSTSHAHEKGTDHVLRRDRVELAAAPVDDQVSLGIFGSGAYLDPLRCTAYFDDLGATTTLNVGSAALPTAMVNGQDVNAAAGSFSLFKGVDIALWFEPLWKVLGMASDPGGKIELFATIKGSAATGTLVWAIHGQDR